jgi:hypothetical protein
MSILKQRDFSWYNIFLPMPLPEVYQKLAANLGWLQARFIYSTWSFCGLFWVLLCPLVRRLVTWALGPTHDQTLAHMRPSGQLYSYIVWFLLHEAWIKYLIWFVWFWLRSGGQCSELSPSMWQPHRVLQYFVKNSIAMHQIWLHSGATAQSLIPFIRSWAELRVTSLFQ